MERRLRSLLSLYRPLFALLCLGPPLANTAPAQSLSGRVVDVASGAALPGALVLVVDATDSPRGMALSDSVGSFLIVALVPEPLRLRVRSVGYVTLETAPFTLGRSDDIDIVVPLMPEPVLIDDVTATATTPRNANFERFLNRRETGFGRFIGPEEIARMQPRSTVGLVATMHPSASVSRSGRGLVFPQAPGWCTPIVFVDGTEVSDYVRSPVPLARGTHALQDEGIVVDRFAPARHVRAVEFYTSPATAPQEFRWSFMPHCAIVVIWTVYGFGLDRVPDTRVDEPAQMSVHEGDRF